MEWFNIEEFIGETIYLNKKEAQIKLDEINEQKYKDYPILK